jgi:tetratricopeptide (TPR) repeat protein
MSTAVVCMIAAALALAALQVAPALAQPPADGEEARAAAHFEHGRARFDAGDFDAAIDAYMAAYALVPAPALLFNVGLAYRAKGDAHAAIDFFQRYLALDPDGEATDEAAEYVAELTAALARQQEGAERDRAEAAGGAGGESGDGRSGGGLRLTGLATAGVGAAALVAGGVFGQRARSIHREIDERTTAWTDVELDELPERFAAGERAERRAILLSAVGGAAVLTGATLYLLGARRDRPSDRRTVRFEPAVAPGMVTLSLAGEL